MGSDKSLLERLADPQRDAPRTLRGNTNQLAKSVLRHLQKMLNTRHGNAPVQLDYGLPDLTELVHSFPESIAQMQKAIRNTIEKYEPRLRAVKVSYVPSDDDPLRVKFEITAQLVTTREKTPIWFETTLDSSGQVEVKE